MDCNMCGETCEIFYPGLNTTDYPNGKVPHGLIEQEVIGGYESTPGNGFGALDDCTAYKFSLCEFCLDWLFCQFKIPVQVRDVQSDLPEHQPEAWRSARQRIAEDAWRRFKKEAIAILDARDASRK